MAGTVPCSISSWVGSGASQSIPNNSGESLSWYQQSPFKRTLSTYIPVAKWDVLGELPLKPITAAEKVCPYTALGVCSMLRQKTLDWNLSLAEIVQAEKVNRVIGVQKTFIL